MNRQTFVSTEANLEILGYYEWTLSMKGTRKRPFSLSEYFLHMEIQEIKQSLRKNRAEN